MINLSQRAEEIVGPDDGNKYHKAKIKLVLNALRQTREEALEEAGKVADDFGDEYHSDVCAVAIAKNIRALKDK